jgi:hypothetical protein
MGREDGEAGPDLVATRGSTTAPGLMSRVDILQTVDCRLACSPKGILFRLARLQDVTFTAYSLSLGRREGRLTEDPLVKGHQQIKVKLALPGMPMARSPVLSLTHLSALAKALLKPLLSVRVGCLTRRLFPSCNPRQLHPQPGGCKPISRLAFRAAM